ncbi:hypothetical protein GGQ80_003400 [Sphingomonas jinjuensis]|uniref:VOC domain-containing protein n=1 Tax=Sphingomonas jinjuensis TaxID=535907 RepID=A0A840FIF6_9SPHN|nr:VOC family protein [Sphingomonas jinjuensis]MBB4155477.1 hypothetical protein [Sphingomonas jinjuensis]
MSNGTPAWFELTTPDLHASLPFYERVAGWQIAMSPAAEHGGYRLASAPDGEAVAGIMTGQGQMPKGWSVYLAADDVDATVARAVELGGSILAGPMDIPHVGRFAAIADPQGVMVNLIADTRESAGSPFKQMEGGAGTGHGVWIELATPDPDAAFAFYGALFGWTKAGAMPMGEMGEYAFIGAGDAPPGAIMSSAATGAPARWNWYVEVPDIDAAIDTAKAEGGALLQGPDQIPGGAFSANIADAQGYQIGLVGHRAGGQ